MRNKITTTVSSIGNEILNLEGDFSKLEVFPIDGDGELKIRIDGPKQFIFIDKEEINRIIEFLQKQLT